MSPTDPNEPFVAPHVTEAEIAELAHFIWLREGRPEGRSAEHWQRAERHLRSEEARIGTVDLSREIPMPGDSERLL